MNGRAGFEKNWDSWDVSGLIACIDDLSRQAWNASQLAREAQLR